MKVGDEVQIKGTKARGILKRIFTEGCQLHGDPIDRVEVLTTEPGHHIKKNMRLILETKDIEIFEGEKETVRVWTLFSSYSTDHDAMKWYVAKDSEITPEVETPERVKVIEHSAYQDLEVKIEQLENDLKYMHETSIAWSKQGLDMFAHTDVRKRYLEMKGK